MAFSKKYKTMVFDWDGMHKNEITCRHKAATQDRLIFTSEKKDICQCNFYVITLTSKYERSSESAQHALWDTCKLVGEVISAGDIVVFDSCACFTTSERECIPIIERASGLTCNSDFFAGHNPGTPLFTENEFSFWNAGKITSGSTPEIAKIVDEVYLNVFDIHILTTPSIGESEVSYVG